MTPEQIYQSVHRRWTAFSNGDFSIDTEGPCAFCGFARSNMERGALNKCLYCPAFHALGKIPCYDHPAMEKFYDDLSGRFAAMAVLELLESVKDKIIQYMEEKQR